jgi:hypothetical protein
LVFSKRGRNAANEKRQSQMEQGQHNERPQPSRPGGPSGCCWFGAGWQRRRGGHEYPDMSTGHMQRRATRTGATCSRMNRMELRA